MASFGVSADGTGPLPLASLRQIDPSTGVAVTVFNYYGPADAEPTFDLFNSPTCLAGWVREQVFDRDLKRMAVNWSESDGSTHVGWVDGDGALTDVTTIVTGAQSDFAAQPKHACALFDAQGHFRYVDATAWTLNTFDVQAMGLVGEPEPCEGWVFLQPDGRAKAEDLYAKGWLHSVMMPGGFVIYSNDWQSIQDPVDGERVLVRTSGDLVSDSLKIMGPANLPKNVDGAYETGDGGSIAAITPSSDWRLGTAAVSGDGGQIAFEASRGDEWALFTMPVGGGEPKKLTQLENDMRLLFWR